MSTLELSTPPSWFLLQLQNLGIFEEDCNQRSNTKEKNKACFWNEPQV